MNKKQYTRNYKIMFTWIMILTILLGYTILYPNDLVDRVDNFFNKNNGEPEYVADMIKLKFTSTMVDTLHQKWDENQNNEYNACLGFNRYYSMNDNKTLINEHIYTIDSLDYIVVGGDNYVNLLDCNKVNIHNHPTSPCSTMLWNGDIESAKKSYQNGATFFMIQCERDKVEVYTRENMLNGVILTISENVKE